MKTITSTLPILTPTSIIDVLTGEMLSWEEFKNNSLNPLLDWVLEETQRIYDTDPEKVQTDALNLKFNAAEYARQCGYITQWDRLSREIKAKSRIDRLVKFKLMSETASYVRNSNSRKQPHSFSKTLNLGAVDSQMVTLGKENNTLILTWKCWDKELEITFNIPFYVLKREVSKWSLPVVSTKGFIFAVQEQITTQTGKVRAGVDLGRVQPFTLVVLSEKGRVSAQYTARPQITATNAKRERILKEIKATRSKAISYEALGLDSSTLREEIHRMRNKVSRIGNSLKNQIAVDITTKITRHSVALLHVEELGWATGAKYGSRWNHGATINKIEHSTARSGIRTKRVNARNTSQLCHKCQSQVVHNDKKRTVFCGECKLTLDRDFNAAINIARNKEFRSLIAGARKRSPGTILPGREVILPPIDTTHRKQHR